MTTRVEATTAAAVLLSTALAAIAATETVTYRYDAAGRLVTAAYESGRTNAVISYTHDTNGNRTNHVTIGANDTAVDSDGDTFADLHELTYFGDLSETAGGDPDGDGLVNTNDVALGGNPALADTDADGMDDGDEALAGTGLADKNDVFEVANVEILPAGNARVWWSAKAGRRYQLQSRYSLSVDGWDDTGSPYDAGSNGQHYADGTYSTNAFFRVEVSLSP